MASDAFFNYLMVPFRKKKINFSGMFFRNPRYYLYFSPHQLSRIRYTTVYQNLLYEIKSKIYIPFVQKFQKSPNLNQYYSYANSYSMLLDHYLLTRSKIMENGKTKIDDNYRYVIRTTIKSKWWIVSNL